MGIGKLQVLLMTVVALAMLALGGAVPCEAQYVTLTGTLAGSNGVVAANYAVNFTPSQIFFIAGTGVVVNTTTACATSVDGSVVGVANPLTAPGLGTVGGTFPQMAAGNYFVETSWYVAAPVGGAVTETLVGPEAVVQLSSAGGIMVSPPTGKPANATGMRVYVGTSSGTETLQATVNLPVSTNLVVMSLVSGAAVPAVNTTVCRQVANDAGWPTGTGYTVSLTDPEGDTLPGYPMEWELLGPGTTIDLSSGLPYYHGVVYFPSPVLTTPLHHALQSVSGPLSTTGFLLNGAGGTLGQALCSSGVTTGATSWCTVYSTLNPPPGGFYQTYTLAGLVWPQEVQAGFTSSFALTDVPPVGIGAGSTTVDLATQPGVTPGQYTNATVTVNGQGIVTAVATGSPSAHVQVNHNVATSRSFGTQYTNATGFGMYLSGSGRITGAGGDSTVSVLVDGVEVYANTVTGTLSGETAGFTGFVPVGSTYKVNVGGEIGAVQGWVESY